MASASDLANPCRAPLIAWAGKAPLKGPVGIAFSAGADSTALLLAAHALWPGQVVGLHVNHGLQAAAAGFEQHAINFGRQIGAPVLTCNAAAGPQPGQSPEDAARRARYGALAMLAREHGLVSVWLAQHQDDQLETVVLALSRGSGVAGLAGMSPRFEIGGVRFERPILDVSAQAIREWLLASGHPFVDDPTNRDLRFTRNRIRHEVTPILRASFPHIAAMVARSSQHMAQAQELLDEIAAEDAERVGLPPQIKALQSLSPARQSNLLRMWIKAESGSAPSQAQLQALLHQVQACQTRGHGIELKVSAGYVTRNGEKLSYQSNL